MAPFKTGQGPFDEDLVHLPGVSAVPEEPPVVPPGRIKIEGVHAAVEGPHRVDGAGFVRLVEEDAVSVRPDPEHPFIAAALMEIDSTGVAGDAVDFFIPHRRLNQIAG